jgi:hypothetical protein
LRDDDGQDHTVLVRRIVTMWLLMGGEPFVTADTLPPDRATCRRLAANRLSLGARDLELI